MSSSDVTKEGITGARSDREALTGAVAGRQRRRGGKGERAMVPPATFDSYYGLPVLNPPVWSPLDIAGYLFLGGLAGASSLLAAGAQLTGRPELARASKVGAFGAISLSAAALVHDLGRPARFVNMLRVLKPTSPMSVGSWVLAGYGPAAGASALSALTGLLPGVGAAATAGAAALAPAVATYTAVLICDTAVPAWHEAYPEMPFVFAGSAASAAGGWGMLFAPCPQAGPARAMALFGAATELAASQRIEHRLGLVGEPYRQHPSGRMMKLAKVMTATGVLGGLAVGRRSQAASRVFGATLVAASAVTRFAIFYAGMTSAKDPKYTVAPQRERLQRGERARATD